MGERDTSALAVEASEVEDDANALGADDECGGIGVSGAAGDAADPAAAGLPDRFAKCENAFGRGFEASAAAAAVVDDCASDGGSAVCTNNGAETELLAGSLSCTEVDAGPGVCITG